MAMIGPSEFLECLYPDLNGSFLEIRRLRPSPGEDKQRRQDFCTSVQEAAKVSQSDSSFDCYFGVGLRSGRVGDEAHVSLLPGLWADVDFKDHGGDQAEAAARIAAFEFGPSAVVDSGNGFHCYWLFKEPVEVTAQNRQTLRGMLLGIAQAVCGDRSAKDLSRILRVPGTQNLKNPENPRPVRVIRLYPERRFNPMDFEHWQEPEEAVLQGGDAAPASEWIPEGQRNKTLTSLAGTMRKRAISEAAIAAALLIENKAKCRPPLPEGEVQQIARSVSRYEPEMGSNLDAAPIGVEQQQQGAVRFQREGATTLREAYIPTHWLVEKIVPVGGVVLLAGEPGIGKTWLTLSMALTIASGQPWLDHFCCEQGRVLIGFEEEDRGAVVDRLDLLYGGLGLDREKGDALPVEFLIQQGISVSKDDRLKALEEEIRAYQPTLVVLDPLRRVHDLEENDSRDMSVLFGVLRQLTQIPDKPCSVLLVHHLRKRGEKDHGLDRIRGSTDIGASVDGVLELSGAFGALKVRHQKSKRGPQQDAFLVKAELSEGAVRLSYSAQEEIAKQKEARIQDFVVDVLRKGPINKTELAKRAKGPGYGRNRIQALLDELERDGRLRIEKEGKNAMLHLENNVVVDPPPYGGSNNVIGSDCRRSGELNLPVSDNWET